ncbi:MAG TPA: hypothetical protein VN112_09405 [Ensifer sp.]|nr:hypothetical protein [Ensifer sp.]
MTGVYQFSLKLRTLADTIFAAFHVDQLSLNAASEGDAAWTKARGAGALGTQPLKPARFDCSMIRVSALNDRAKAEE